VALHFGVRVGFGACVGFGVAVGLGSFICLGVFVAVGVWAGVKVAALAATRDSVLPRVIVELRKAGLNNFVFFRATLREVRVASVGLVETDDQLQEKVTFRPRQIVLEYTPTRSEGRVRR